MDHQVLIREIENGNEEAFKSLVESFQDLVFNTCFGFVRTRENAEDLAQEVFMEVYQSIGTFRGEAKLSTWIYRITVNKCLEYVRKQKRKKRFGLLTSIFDDPPGVQAGLQNWDHPGVDLENKERSQMLFQAIEKLPDRQRVAFTLSKVEGLSNREISGIMETTLSSVESLMHRAKENLRRNLRTIYQ